MFNFDDWVRDLFKNLGDQLKELWWLFLIIFIVLGLFSILMKRAKLKAKQKTLKYINSKIKEKKGKR